MGDVEVTPLDLFQELPQVVVVEGEGADEEGVEDDPAGPHVRSPAVVLLALKY